MHLSLIHTCSYNRNSGSDPTRLVSQNQCGPDIYEGVCMYTLDTHTWIHMNMCVCVCVWMVTWITNPPEVFLGPSNALRYEDKDDGQITG